jgi:hypothetical protein
MSVFAVGQVVAAYTRYAKNYRRKYKYHLCVCCSANIYLFINSKWFKGSFEICNADLPKLPNPVSYISCSEAICISDEEMKKCGGKVIGQLSRARLQDLLQHVEESYVMSEDDKERILVGLSDELL